MLDIYMFYKTYFVYLVTFYCEYYPAVLYIYIHLS